MWAEKFIENSDFTTDELECLLNEFDKSMKKQEILEQLCALACKRRDRIYGKKVFIRGLIEFTNYCKNNCYYCGIRKDNKKILRYRLTKEEILDCCRYGYETGFRTFVLQGGEDGYFTDERLGEIIRHIREEFPDCAITLSVGERSGKSYEYLKKAGADRYLLRHETADDEHYRMLHPENLNLKNRMECLKELKKIGFQTGAGFMVGSPGQTNRHLSMDLSYLKKLSPQMVGIGPFLPHRDTPFAGMEKGEVDKTIFLLAVTRILLPHVLLPATTALGTAQKDGRIRGLMAGANVVMPNLSPLSVRKQYMLYDNKANTGEEAAEGLEALERQVQSIGMEIDFGRGDFID